MLRWELSLFLDMTDTEWRLLKQKSRENFDFWDKEKSLKLKQNCFLSLDVNIIINAWIENWFFSNFFFKNQLLSKKDVYKKWAGPTSDPEQDFSFDRKRVTSAPLLLQNTKFWRFQWISRKMINFFHRNDLTKTKVFLSGQSGFL